MLFRKTFNKIFPARTIRRKIAKAIYLLFFDWKEFRKRLKIMLSLVQHYGVKSVLANPISIYRTASHFIAKITRQYYFEDYIRVYPDNIVFDHHGKQKNAKQVDVNNFLNHCKVYKFAAQFVKDKFVADIGCGSGYGCEILRLAGAARVCGTDISKSCIKFAQSRYGNSVEFTVQDATDLKEYLNDFFDVTMSSEVLEHVKEYGMEQKTINELKRITKNKGLLVIGTPNSEMLGEHGFSFDEINGLFSKNFSQFCIFENALLPFGDRKLLWEKRLSESRVGTIISEAIDLLETVIPKDHTPELKSGIPAGRFKFVNYDVDTSLLHNTHSWVILAVNNK